MLADYTLPMAQKNAVSSYAEFIGSMLIFGTIGLFRRYIPISSSLLAFLRGLFGSLFLILFLKLKGRKVFHEKDWKKVFLLALSGGLMGANWIFLFEAYNATSIATATLCYYMEPTFVILLSPFLFKEKLTRRKGVCVLASLLGMVMVSGVLDGQGVSSRDLKGILLGLAAAALYASVVTMNKLVSIKDAYEKTVIQLSSAALVLVPYLLVSGEFTSLSLDGMGILMVLVVGLIHTGLAYALYFGSMTGLKAQSIAILSYIDPVSALLLSALFLHESMTLFGILGAVLIIGSAILSELKKK